MQNEDDIAKDEAADWAILLLDDPDNAEQQALFATWLAASTVNAEAWAHTQQIYTGLGQLSPTTQALWPTSSSTAPNQRARPLPTKKLAAALAVAACLVLFVLPALQLRWSADYITGTGQQLSLTLEDGSQVQLAPESAIEITFSQNRRHVHLLKGTAYFEVSPDANRPFSVDAGATEASVLGTAFNMQRRNLGAVVSVSHGQVRVDDYSISPSVSEILLPGERLAVAWGKAALRSEIALDEIAQWRAGELIARELPISEVVAALEAYHNGSIIIPASFAQRRVTGLYRLDTPVATLNDLAASHGATVYQLSPWVLLVRD